MKTYKIDRAIGQPLEFRGLKAQYVGRLLALTTGIFAAMGVMHMLGVPPLLTVLLALGLGGFGIKKLYRLNRIYGQYGLMKRRARRSIPSALYSRSREIFIQLYEDAPGCKFK